MASDCQRDYVCHQPMKRSFDPQRKTVRLPCAMFTFTVYCIVSNNSQGRLFLFLNQKGPIIKGRRLFEEAIILNISYRRSCRIYFVLLHHAIKEKVKYKNITIEKNCTKKTRCFCNRSVVNNKMKASLLPKMSIFNLRARG